MTMGKISSKIIKECGGKHAALCSFCVTISILGISYKKSNLENTLQLSKDAALHARWTSLCLSVNSHCWRDVKSKANPERSCSMTDAFPCTRGEISEASIYRAATGGVEREVSSADVCSHPGRLQRKIQSGPVLAEILGDWERSADAGEGLRSVFTFMPVMVNKSRDEACISTGDMTGNHEEGSVQYSCRKITSHFKIFSRYRNYIKSEIYTGMTSGVSISHERGQRYPRYLNIPIRVRAPAERFQSSPGRRRM